jgi:ribosome-binding protein aMBF1 (putative translation factor)
MVSETKNTRSRRSKTTAKRITRLEAEVARLRAENRTLKAAKSRPPKTSAAQLPALPPADDRGYYPAAEALNVIVARQIIRRRQALGWSQAELARQAGVRPETLSRLESGKHAPNLATVDKLEHALREAEA